MSERSHIDAALVHRLILAQFPHWAGLPIRPVAYDGWDNRTFHLGDAMKVRLPSAAPYVAQVEKEHRWLPALAPHLPLPIPTPLAIGAPGEGYPWPWSVYLWLAGEMAARERIRSLDSFATDIAEFLTALYRVDATGGPVAGAHNFHRGGSLRVYDAETRETIARLGSSIDGAAVIAAWDAALASQWRGSGVWVHGDVAVGNLLVADGRLAAVIDFGSSGVGDPACDLVLAWTFLGGSSRKAFRATLGFDAATRARARGWALWKALITIANGSRVNPAETPPRDVVAAVLAEHAANG